MTYKLHTKSFDTLLRLEPRLGGADERTLSLYHLAGMLAGNVSATLDTPPGKLMIEIRDQVAALGNSR